MDGCLNNYFCAGFLICPDGCSALTLFSSLVSRLLKAIIEPIFGRWQHNWGIRRLRLRGLAGFSAELHLMAIAHNMTKLFRFGQGMVQAAAKA